MKRVRSDLKELGILKGIRSHLRFIENTCIDNALMIWKDTVSQHYFFNIVNLDTELIWGTLLA